MQLNNEFYVAVVNKSSDEVAKTLGSSYSAPQIAFLKTVVRSLPSHHSMSLASLPVWMVQFPGCPKGAKCLRFLHNVILLSDIWLC